MVSQHIQDSSKGSHIIVIYYQAQDQEVLGVKGCLKRNSSLTSAKNKTKLEYISETIITS